MKTFGAKKIILLGLIFIFFLSGCQNQTTENECFTSEQIEDILESSVFVNNPPLKNIAFDKYSADEFLFNNQCFSFYRDMDYYLLFSARYDFRDSIVNTYPPQAVRTIENNGQKSMYIVYETDDKTRVFVFFFESDGFQFTRGYPIVMKKSLEMSDFSTLENGDSMDDVEKIDPIAALYRKGYDTLSDELIHSLYVNGKETISSVHLLTDGIIRINYTRNSEGSYIIEQIIKSENFTIPVIGGRLCYLIYPEDYI